MKRLRVKLRSFTSVLSTLFYCLLALALFVCLVVVLDKVKVEGPITSSTVAFEIGFSPKGRSLNIILDGIDRAEKSILVAAYTFANPYRPRS